MKDDANPCEKPKTLSEREPAALVLLGALSAGQGVGGGVWHKASVSDCLPLAAPIGLSPLLILTLCGPERVLVVSTEPLDDLSCLTVCCCWGEGQGFAYQRNGGGLCRPEKLLFPRWRRLGVWRVVGCGPPLCSCRARHATRISRLSAKRDRLCLVRPHARPPRLGGGRCLKVAA